MSEHREPSVGRIVHYVAYGTPAGVCLAAVVTEVEPSSAAGEQVGICVLSPTGQSFVRFVKQDDATKEPGTWHWPERV